MHKITLFWRFTVILIVLATMTVTWRASATVFTTNTDIAFGETNYDGQDIVISNCTVTVEGEHAFSSLTVATNGDLTSTFSSSAQLVIAVVNEPVILNGTNPNFVGSNVFTPLLVTDEGQDIVYSNGIDYLEIVLTNGDGNNNDNFIDIERTTNSSIPDGGTVLVSFSYYGVGSFGPDLAVTGMVWVADGGEIDADGIGDSPGTGPGAGSSSTGTFFSGSGGGDGGGGGMSLSNALGGVCYDSLYQPGLPGSGGGASYAGTGGNGGGLIQITAGGNVEIDGLISANGQNATNSRAGGGSGGGVWISAPSVSGAGSITANGGSGVPDGGGGGGGGRIAIVCGTNTFVGATAAYGGSGANYGGAGTVFTQVTGQMGLLTLDNGGKTGTNSTVTLSTMANVAIADGAILAASSTFSVSNVMIGTNGVLTFSPTAGVHSMSNLAIGSGGLLAGAVSTLGEPGNGGTYSAGGIPYGGGGGYGGNGGAAAVTNAVGGLSYGQQMTPSIIGSLGGGVNSGGGLAGGVVDVDVTGTILDNGTISANGGNGGGVAGGGGSGGSVYLEAGTVSGNGLIAANGGAGASLGGGGGGGRVAVYVQQANTFTGAITAYGGGGANYGGAGTVIVQSGPGGSAQEQLIVDNDGNPGPPTILQSGNFVNLVIQNGAWASTLSQEFNSLTIASNSWLTCAPNYSMTSLTIISNVTIQVGGGITLNSDGYPPNAGDTGNAGDSSAPPYGGGGGGNGGFGAPSEYYQAAGGQAGYNSFSAPSYAGGGGGGFAPESFGGYGGGSFGLHVSGTLQLNGTISANGGNGAGAGGGGGAGGSLTISAGLLSGSGSISANGGNGANAVGGGGGGGCIAITFNTNSYVGTMTALGGTGAYIGGAGTIYFKTNSAVNGQLLVDNGGQNGAGSAFQSSSATTDLTLRDAGVLILGNPNPVTYGTVVITNASIVITNGTFQMTANYVTVQKGGGIIANSAGYSANNGPYAGRSGSLYPYYPCGGGGNGGCGGSSITNAAAGGGANGNYTVPTYAGSGGGASTPYSYGGTGGGMISLNVSKNLTVNGTISANGGYGSGSGGGGGAGGGLGLTVGSLSGSGVISANGGNGANGMGGGGGGGVIDVNYQVVVPTNSFTGVISAYGGLGGTNGGAGTILIKTNFNNTGTLIVDNGGNVGTNTPILNETSSGYNLQVRNGAEVAVVNTGEGFQNVLVTSNAWIVPGSSAGQVQLSVLSVATINAGGGIIADLDGSAQNTGSAPGRSYPVGPLYPCSGAGHGGFGASSLSNSVAGGGPYDNANAPFYIGSGGGGYVPYSTGGSGGGLVNLTFPNGGVLQLNGTISANGGAGSGTGGGGGSGGSIYITAGSISGTGSITANGGNGAPAGGGGGGGLIALVYNRGIATNFFAGNMSAYGGGGANYGGAGLIYLQTNQSNPYLVLLDNDGNIGTNTPLSNVGGNVTVQNGAIGMLSTSIWEPYNVLVLSNSAITVQAGASSEFTVEAVNLTIGAGCAFTIDGDGSGPTFGAGGGFLSGGIAGGGGHGGYGGGNLTQGGGAYDSIQAPTLTGSGGASVYTPALAAGGSGGGNIIIEVVSNLVVNGRLSGNGLSGGRNAGGGAGGSIYLENIPNLSGSGVISVNGGAALGTGGGGGGGRIAAICTSNNFTGQFSASGGGGNYPGGAGTIYTKINGVQTLIANNGGIAGTNTPLSIAFSLPSPPFELDITGGASVVPLTPLPLLSNLNVSAASTLTMPVALSNLFVGVTSNANIAGNLDVDYLGYPQLGGIGAGVGVNNEGSGGGYGGGGGAAGNGALGGGTYGWAAAPTDFGSGGGNGVDTTSGGSAGGGALRLSVLGTLTVNGDISANGESGFQDNSGGGSGGSVWISAGTLSGAGTISAYGGDGVLYDGGGGGGGRVAIYAQTNQFTGTTNVTGGTGAVPGSRGTVTWSNALDSLQIVLQSPSGTVTNTVSAINLTFSDLVNASSVSPSYFTLDTPAGTLVPGPNVTVVSPYSVQLSFPTQNLNGAYTLVVQGPISDLSGASLSQLYFGEFTISLPAISGTVTGTNGAGVAGVTMQPSGGLTAATTDSNGNYSVGVPTGWTGSVTPSFGSNVFVPPSLSYTNISNSLTSQNYSMYPTISPTVTTSLSAGNFSLNWNGISGVSYQVLWSTNLVTWQPLGSAITGTNGLMQIALPTGSNASEFFQIQAAN